MKVLHEFKRRKIYPLDVIEQMEMRKETRNMVNVSCCSIKADRQDTEICLKKWKNASFVLI